MPQENEKPVTALTRAQARRFLKQFETALDGELDYYRQPDNMAEVKFLKLFSVEKAELIPQFRKFTHALSNLANGEPFDKQAIEQGLNIMAGIVRISADADSMAPGHAKAGKVAKE